MKNTKASQRFYIIIYHLIFFATPTRELISEPVLVLHGFDQPFYVTTDASIVAMSRELILGYVHVHCCLHWFARGLQWCALQLLKLTASNSESNLTNCFHTLALYQ